MRFLDKEFWEKVSARFTMSFFLSLFLVFYKVFQGVLLFLHDIFLIIFHTVLVFALVFISDEKFFQVSHFDSLIVLHALS